MFISRFPSGGGAAENAIINVTTTSQDFIGQTVTLTGAESQTAVFSEDGTCSFKVKHIGSYTLTCREVSTTVEVDMLSKVLDVELNSQVVNYTMLYDEGDECTEITGGYSSVNVQSNPAPTYTKNVDNLRIYTSGGGNTQNGSFGSYVTNNSIDVSSYSSFGVKGKFYTSNNGVGQCASYAFLAPTNDGTYADMVCNIASGFQSVSNKELGIYSVSLDNVDKTVPLYLNLGVVSYVSSYSAETILYNAFLVKEDNWQEWLSKAGLSTETYTTLDSVLVDETALTTLMNNQSAVNYMLLNCTGTVMASVIQSETALNAIRDSQYNAQIYANVHWNKFLRMVGEVPESEKTYLYKYGDECESLTGGWTPMTSTFSGWTTVAPLKNETDIELCPTTSTANNDLHLAEIYTANKIDLSKYNKLCIKYMQENYNTSNSGSCYGCYTSVPAYMNSYYTVIAWLPSSNVYSISELDISNVTTEEYIILFSNRGIKTNVYAVWLE